MVVLEQLNKGYDEIDVALIEACPTGAGSTASEIYKEAILGEDEIISNLSIATVYNRLRRIANEYHGSPIAYVRVKNKTYYVKRSS